MRKIIIFSMITLDGVMQAPGDPGEDTSGDFKYGGWTVPFADEYMMVALHEELGHPFDLLLGRKTYEIWEPYWPIQKGFIAEAFNKATKYVASKTLIKVDWEKTVILKDNVVDELKRLKHSEGPELQVHGSGNFIQTLLENDLVDEMHLRIFSITLGSGKRLFESGTIPAAFTLESCNTTQSGVIYANYKRAGEVKTGSFL